MDKLMTRQPSVFSRSSLLGYVQRYWVLFLLLMSLTVFLELAEDVLEKEPFAWDAPLMRKINFYNRPWLESVMKVITIMGREVAVLSVAVAFYWLGRRQRWRDATTLLLAWFGIELFNNGLKLIFARTRPDVFLPLVVESGFSFPSGHTVVATVVYGLLATLFWEAQHRVWAVVTTVFIPLVALSRVYLGVHYPSDVLASMMVGILWVYAMLRVRTLL